MMRVVEGLQELVRPGGVMSWARAASSITGMVAADAGGVMRGRRQLARVTILASPLRFLG